jgi:hypothetical protein
MDGVGIENIKTGYSFQKEGEKIERRLDNHWVGGSDCAVGCGYLQRPDNVEGKVR